jgi:glycosyltransferase involved in cell wall biosynthesis
MIQQIWTSKANQSMGPADEPHVLLIVDQFGKTLGGGEKIVLRLARLLPQYGFRVSILTFLVDPQSPVLDEFPVCPLYVLPLRRTYDLHALLSANALRQFLRKENIRIVQTFFESSDLWAGVVVKAFSTSKLIWSRRDMGILRSPKHQIAYRLLSRLPDLVFAVSEQVRRHCIEVDRIDPAFVRTIHNGLTITSPGARHAAVQGFPLITTVGNIRRVKGHDVFIRAAAIVIKRCPEASFSVAGSVLEPEYFKELEILVEELGLSQRFRFTGPVTRVAAHLQSCDIFVLPSRSEGFSNAIIEAMSESLPVVATDVGGNAEAVLDKVSGFIVAPDDAPALADAITKLCLDPKSCCDMGRAGREIVEERFSEEAMMRRVQSAYVTLLDSVRLRDVRHAKR